MKLIQKKLNLLLEASPLELMNCLTIIVIQFAQFKVSIVVNVWHPENENYHHTRQYDYNMMNICPKILANIPSKKVINSSAEKEKTWLYYVFFLFWYDFKKIKDSFFNELRV